MNNTYRNMMQELEMIVKDIQTQDLDIDQVVGRIEKGYELVKTLKTKLSETKLRVEHLRSEYLETSSGQENNTEEENRIE